MENQRPAAPTADQPEAAQQSPKPVLRTIPTKEIALGERARKRYQGLRELAQDIQRHGLIHPIAVREAPPGAPGTRYYVLAGGRRFSACVLAGLEEIPCHVYPATLSMIDQKEIELQENLLREALSWQEVALLREQLHKLEEEKHGHATVRTTARVLDISPSAVSRDLRLAEGLKKYGDALQAEKTQKQALLRLEKLERAERNARIAQAAKAKIPEAQKADSWLLHGYLVSDFFEGVKRVPDGAVGLVEVDPPYGIDIARLKYTTNGDAHKQRMEDYHEIPQEDYKAFVARTLAACTRVMAPWSWLVWWYAAENYQLVLEAMQEAGLVPCPIPGLWLKFLKGGQAHHPDLYLASSYEFFLYARKGSPTLARQGRSNVFIQRPVLSHKKDHPTERPVQLLEEILRTFGNPTNHIMVPFLGSGNTLLAAANLGWTGFGFDLSQAYHDAFIARATGQRPFQSPTEGGAT